MHLSLLFAPIFLRRTHVILDLLKMFIGFLKKCDKNSEETEQR
ncbi:hypothetical protein LEP1GSC170_4519 [Leptospira interrogans serovar Bataviae str. HAI135]|nr:hypothetical protein LEP1GSC170_4519 [Leptospira interrogans serovar Bataviae str. HAI135]